MSSTATFDSFVLVLHLLFNGFQLAGCQVGDLVGVKRLARFPTVFYDCLSW